MGRVEQFGSPCGMLVGSGLGFKKEAQWFTYSPRPLSRMKAGKASNQTILQT
jgi:hypothetical protein